MLAGAERSSRSGYTLYPWPVAPGGVGEAALGAPFRRRSLRPIPAHPSPELPRIRRAEPSRRRNLWAGRRAPHGGRKRRTRRCRAHGAAAGFCSAPSFGSFSSSASSSSCRSSRPFPGVPWSRRTVSDPAGQRQSGRTAPHLPGGGKVTGGAARPGPARGSRDGAARHRGGSPRWGGPCGAPRARGRPGFLGNASIALGAK